MLQRVFLQVLGLNINHLWYTPAKAMVAAWLPPPLALVNDAYEVRSGS